MRILIPTYGRSQKQITFNELPQVVRAEATLIIDAREEGEYPSYPTITTPADITGICATRKWCLANLTSPDCKQVQLDDDLVFALRRDDNPTKFIPAEATDICELFDDIGRQLDNYAHIGVGTREGGNRRTTQYCDVGRTLRILGYRQDILELIKPTDMDGVMEDFDLTLQLLKAGYPNRIINWIVHNQGGSNTAGGCSTYRTMELQGQAAEKLAEKHHPFVKVVTKQTKTAWGGAERKDVIVQWKKAYQSADSNPHVRPPDS